MKEDKTHNIGHSRLDCRFYVPRGRVGGVFLVPGTHADKPSAQKFFLSQYAVLFFFVFIAFVHPHS